MFLDDIADAVKDVASTVADGVGAVAKEAYSTVLSPAESIAMKGLGGAASTVSGLFGNVDLFDSALDGAKGIAGLGLGIASPLLTAELGMAKGIIGGGARGGNDILKLFGGEHSQQASSEKASGHLQDLLANQTHREAAAQKSNNWQAADSELNPQPLPPLEKFGSRFDRFGHGRFNEASDPLNPQPLPPHPDEMLNTEFGKFRQTHRTEVASDPLNPQPLPPHPDEAMSSRIREAQGTRFNVGDPLNPQPLPPHPDDLNSRFRRVMEEDEMMNSAILQGGRLKEVSDPLNPQPLPPHPDDLNAKFRQVMEEDEMMNSVILSGSRREVASEPLNPQPLPPNPNELSVANLNLSKLNRAKTRFL